MRRLVLFVAFVLVMVSPLVAAEPPADAEFFVSPTGSDENPGTEARPIATVRRAKYAVRERIKKGLDEPVTVFLREGTYRIERPLVFGPEDSGTADHAISFAAYPEEQVVVSGGKPVKGWERASNGVWSSDAGVLSEVDGFRNLFVNGKRAIRARTPNGSADRPYVKLTGVSLSDDRSSYTLQFDAEHVDNWNPEGLEVAVFGNWAMNRLPVRRIEPETGRVVLDPPHAVGHRSTRPEKGRWAYFENARAMLDRPGEWYFDRADNTLYYRPRKEENMREATVVAPATSRLIEVEGSPERSVRNLHFERIRFMHMDWPLPDHGYMGIQATHITIGNNWHRPWGRVPAAIRFDHAEGMSMENCEITHTGGSGIALDDGCRENTVRGNHISDVAANGVMVGGSNTRGDTAADNVIANNHVHACGRVYKGAVGIWIGFAEGTSVKFNRVHDLPYTGISVGWQWNPKPTSCRENRIANNHIHNVVRRLCDGGGIYTLGLQPGTILRGNHIHDVRRSRYAQGAPNNGIFFDQGSKGYRVEDNVIYGTSGDPIRFNQSERGWHTWKNNHFGGDPGAGKAQVAADAGLQPPFRNRLLPDELKKEK